jgi:hypothetical protein
MNSANMLRQYIDQDVIDQASELASRFSCAQPFRHVQIDNFFTPTLSRELSENFPPFDESLAINENGEVGNKAVHEQIMHLGPAWESLDLLVQDDYGGSIQLHKDPYSPSEKDQVTSISPLFNRCVIFETHEHSWHGFPRINLPKDKRSLSRRSFALYYYTDSRPEKETGPEHSTIYVDERLPAKYEAGLILDENDIQGIHSLLGSRDQHIRRLYDNIKELTADANKLSALHAFHEEQQAELEFLRKESLKQSDLLNGARVSEERVSLELDARGEEVRRLRARIQNLMASTSWRITQPLRKFKMLLKRDQ